MGVCVGVGADTMVRSSSVSSTEQGTVSASEAWETEVEGREGVEAGLSTSISWEPRECLDRRSGRGVGSSSGVGAVGGGGGAGELRAAGRGAAGRAGGLSALGSMGHSS